MSEKLANESQLTEALRRQALLEKVGKITGAGGSLSSAADLLGEDVASLCRWRKAYQAGGFDALIPQHHKSGRKPLCVLTPEEKTLAQRLYVQTESKTTALRMLAHADECSDATRAAILKPRASKHTLTKSLRSSIDVAPAVLEYYKSPKETALNYFFNPRDLSYTDAAGKRQELQPGDLFEDDDMTVNFGWWVPWPGGDKCSDKYGVRLLRGQLLPPLDVRSLKFVSFALIARLKDSYRQDDVWQSLGNTFRDVGLPRIGMRLERGIWEGGKIAGVPLEASAHTSLERRLGGLGALGLRVIRSYSPLTKIIENRFNFLQTWMATIPGQLGRTRGEMERQTKLWSACRDGRADPRDYFLPIDEVANRIEAVFHAVNSEPVEGEIYRGVPDEVWAAGLQAQPLRRLPDAQAWLFARDRRVVTVCKGMARVRLTGPAGPFSYWFHQESLYKLESQKVAVYFDPYLEGGTAVITDAAGENPNEIFCVATEVGRAPQFSMAAGYDDESGYARRNAFANAVRTEYRALGLAGTRLVKRSDQNFAGISGTGVPPVTQTTSPRATGVQLRQTSPDRPGELSAEDQSPESRVQGRPRSTLGSPPSPFPLSEQRLAEVERREAALRAQGILIND